MPPVGRIFLRITQEMKIRTFHRQFLGSEPRVLKDRSNEYLVPVQFHITGDANSPVAWQQLSGHIESHHVPDTGWVSRFIEEFHPLAITKDMDTRSAAAQSRLACSVVG